MHDGRIIDNLQNIIESINLIQARFSKINLPEDFVNSPDGVLLLDSISMRLQVVGDMVKTIYKLAPDVLTKYTSIEWPNIMRMRDLISHHYDQVDHEIIFDICKNHIPKLKTAIKTILADD